MARTRLSSLSGLPTEAPGVVAVLNFGGTSPARPFRCTAGSQRYGGGRLRQPCFLRKSGWEEKAALSSSAPQPEGEAGFARGGGARARRGHGAGVHQPGRVTTCPFSAAALEEGAAGGPGGSSGCARLAMGAAEQWAPTPRAPMPRECPVAGSFRGVLGARSWPEGRGWGSAEAELGAPHFGGLPPRPRSSLPGAGSAGRTLVHPASPAQGQRKELFLFAGAVGSGTHRPCCGSVGPCRRRGDSPVADPGLCSGHGPAWAGEFPACRRLLLRQRTRLSLA